RHTGSDRDWSSDVCSSDLAPDHIPHYLWKLLIDHRHQRRGYGKATLDLIAEYFRGRPGVDVLSTSAGEARGGPIPFYERYGFVQVGRASCRDGLRVVVFMV